MTVKSEVAFLPEKVKKVRECQCKKISFVNFPRSNFYMPIFDIAHLGMEYGMDMNRPDTVGQEPLSPMPSFKPKPKPNHSGKDAED